MEHSPLRFLDNDLSIMLCEHVRNSQEKLSRDKQLRDENTRKRAELKKEKDLDQRMVRQIELEL